MAELKVRFGPAGVPLSAKARDTASGILECSELGLSAMEVEFVRGVKMSIENALECAEVSKENNIRLSAHAPYFINLASEDIIKRKKSVQFILHTAKIANALGAELVVFHAGFYYKNSKEQTYSLIKEGLQQILSVIKDRKWNVLLAPETTGRQAQFGTLEEILSLCRELKGVVPTVDFAHIHARTNGSLRKRENFCELFDNIERNLDLLKSPLHIHFTGVEYRNGNEKKHLSLDKGDLKFELLAQELKSRKLMATIISESPVLEQDALKMKDIWERDCGLQLLPLL